MQRAQLLSRLAVGTAKTSAPPGPPGLFAPPQSDGSMIFMIFVAPEPDFNHLKPTYEAMLTSVQIPLIADCRSD